MCCSFHCFTLVKAVMIMIMERILLFDRHMHAWLRRPIDGAKYSANGKRPAHPRSLSSRPVLFRLRGPRAALKSPLAFPRATSRSRIGSFRKFPTRLKLLRLQRPSKLNFAKPVN
jgi:hypothetical protein